MYIKVSLIHDIQVLIYRGSTNERLSGEGVAYDSYYSETDRVNTKIHIYKSKEKGQKDTVGINDIGIFEFIFQGLPNPPDLEGMDKDRLRELQNAIQEQLCQRDEERERNITKRVQEFEKTFNFVNSHLLKGVATMAKLTKTE